MFCFHHLIVTKNKIVKLQFINSKYMPVYLMALIKTYPFGTWIVTVDA